LAGFFSGHLIDALQAFRLFSVEALDFVGAFVEGALPFVEGLFTAFQVFGPPVEFLAAALDAFFFSAELPLRLFEVLFGLLAGGQGFVLGVEHDFSGFVSGLLQNAFGFGGDVGQAAFVGAGFPAVARGNADGQGHQEHNKEGDENG